MSLLPESASGRSLRQVILISLIPGNTANPHHRAAGRAAPGAVFHTGDSSAYLAFVERRFEELEQQGRARLISVEVTGPGDDGIRAIDLTYTDLETGEVETIQEAL